MTKISMSSRLDLAQRTLDASWPSYDGTPSRQLREGLIDEAIREAFPESGITLSDENLQVLAATATSARRSQVALNRLRRERENLARQRPSEESRLGAWGAAVAARQALDWVKLVERLLLAMRRYVVVEGIAAGLTPALHKAAQRFARRCAADHGIATPLVRWIRPVQDGGDLVTLGDIAGCVPKHDRSVIFVRADILTERERLRVVAHEVAHQGGADERGALAYELEALRRHHRPTEFPRPLPVAAAR